jgi:hypothetical protein
VVNEDPGELEWRDRLSVRAIAAHQATGRFFAPFLRPGVWLVGFVGAVYSACSLARLQDFPSADAWKGDSPLRYLLIGTGIFALIAGALVLAGYSALLKKSERNDDLAEACKGVWHVAVQELQCPLEGMEKVGVQLWQVRGFTGARFLERRASFTLEPRGETKIVWRKGKGAIGVAWAANDAKIASVAEVEARAGTKDQFYALSRDERYGLTWDEFRKAKRYRAILAIPLETRPNHVAGCLSIDVRLDGYDQKLDTVAKAEQLTRALMTCESILRGGA